jgi:hypothetical protein
MNYKGQNIDIKHGDIILYRYHFNPLKPYTYLSVVVRTLTNIRYNHCALVVETNGKLMLNEAIAEGVVSNPVEQTLEHPSSDILILRAKELPPFFLERAVSGVGKKYDYKFLFADQLWYRLSRIWTGHTEKFADEKFACAEYAGYCLGMDGWWKYSDKELLSKLDIVYVEKLR